MKTITDDNMKEAMQADVAVVDFNAVWCGPCKMLGPVLEQLAEEMEGKVEFFSCDVDENMALSADYNIQSVPTVLLLKKGTVVSQSIGFRPKDAMRSWIESNC